MRCLTLPTIALAAAAAAMPMSSMSRGEISYGIDTAVFSAGDEGLALEVYQELEIDQLARDSSGTAYFVTQVALTNAEGDTVAMDQWASRPEWMEGRRLVNETVLPVSPGGYVLEVLLTDMNNGLQGRVERPIEVAPLEGLSQIELARVLIPCSPTSTNRLRKGAVLVYPAAEGRFTLPSSPLVYLYAELYDRGGEEVAQRSVLRSPEGAAIFARPWKTFRIPEGGDAIGLLDSISLGGARTPGLYSVEMAVAAGEDTMRRVKPFMIDFEGTAAAQPGADGRPEGGPRYLDEMRWVLAGSERDILESLDTPADRAAFYDEYWAGSPEERRQFESRCQQAERFGNQFTAGWRTDRGRVTILYGEPDNVERNVFSIDALPHETWYYDSGNEQFVFVDGDGDGVYEQIYSTVDGEVSYDNWRELLNPTNRQGGM